MLIVLVTLSFSNIRWGEVEAVSEINMLYIGNSKTYYNIFPRMYRYLAISGEKNDAKLTAVVAGGRTLEQHATKLESIYDKNGKIRTYAQAKKYVQQKNSNWNFLSDEYTAYKSAFEKNWSYIVLQEQTDNAKDEKKMLEPSKRIIAVLKKYGKNTNFKVVYNAIWPQYEDSLTKLKTEQNKINATNKVVADKTGGIVSYSGQAIYNYLTENSSEDYTSMYIKDKNHPTQAGSYLSACCLYYAIYGESPVGIKYYGAVKDAKSNPIINLNYSKDNSKNGENFTGRKALGDLDSGKVTKLQKVAKSTMESNTSPTINSIKANVTTPTNQNVVVTVSAEDRVSKIKDYSWDGKKTWQTGKTKTISKNGTYTVYVRNNKNKISSKSITISNIDKTAPIILGIEEGMIYYESVAPIIIEKNIDLIELKKDENKIVEYKNGNRINENGKYTLKVKDKANNTIVINFTINLLSLERIIIAKNPNKIEYIEGQNFDKTGMIVKAVYSNETSKKVENYEILGGENLEKGTINVKNSYT